MQAIETRYFSCTNHRPSRIRAKAAAKTRFYPYDHALNLEDNHLAAAHLLATELEWDSYGAWHSGTLANGDDVHVCEPNAQ